LAVKSMVISGRGVSSNSEKSVVGSTVLCLEDSTVGELVGSGVVSTGRGIGVLVGDTVEAGFSAGSSDVTTGLAGEIGRGEIDSVGASVSSDGGSFSSLSSFSGSTSSSWIHLVCWYGSDANGRSTTIMYAEANVVLRDSHQKGRNSPRIIQPISHGSCITALFFLIVQIFGRRLVDGKLLGVLKI
jgi:hypothetical protein